MSKQYLVITDGNRAFVADEMLASLLSGAAGAAITPWDGREVPIGRGGFTSLPGDFEPHFAPEEATIESISAASPEEIQAMCEWSAGEAAAAEERARLGY